MTEHDTKLAERLETARVRSSELAANTSNKALEFIQDHPVATIAGGIAIGALIAGVLARRSPPTVAKAGEAFIDASAAQLSKLATLGTEIALAYVARAAVAGKQGVDQMEDRLSGPLGQIGDNSAEAGRKLSALGEIALKTLREAGETALSRLKQKG